MLKIYDDNKKFKILLILFCCLLLVSCNNTDYKSIECPYKLKQLYMCNAKSAWGLSFENEILFTENGLENFKPVKILENINSFTDGYAKVAFINEQLAYITYFSSDNEHLIVEYTADGGNNWHQTLIKYGDYSENCDAGSIFISFANDKEGYLLYCSTPALGQMTKLLFFTDDGGQTFSFTEELTNTISGYPQGITVIDNKTVNIAVTYHGTGSYLYQTTDGAENWETIEIFPRTEDVRYVDGYIPVFYRDNKQNGIIILKVVRESAAYELFVTNNAGSSWTLDSEIPCDSLLDYTFINEKQIYIIDSSGTLFEKNL